MGKSQKVANLFEKRQKIEKEIEKLQKLCHHSTTTLKSIRERVDSSSTVIRWVCDECFLPIGYPSEKEQKNYFRQ